MMILILAMISYVLIFYFPQHIIVNVFLSYDNDGANA